MMRPQAQFRPCWILALFSAAVAVCVAGASGIGIQYLKFTSSRTGLAVQPAKIFVDGKPTAFHSDEHGLLRLDLSNGPHTIRIEAKGFDPIETRTTVMGDVTPTQEMELDPAAGQQQPEVPDGFAVIEGTVSDDDTGEPIPGAKVTLPDASMTSATTAEGQFEMQLKLPEASDNTVPVISMEISHQGYRTQKLANLKLAPASRRLMPIRMEPVTTGTESLIPLQYDELKPRGPIRDYQWTYDATVD